MDELRRVEAVIIDGKSYIKASDAQLMWNRIGELEKALGSMKAAFRVNMIRYANASDEEIDAVICAALGEKKDD